MNHHVGALISKLTEVTTQLISALYVRRGIQNMQVYNMEWQIPIPPQSAQGEVKRDWSIIQQAWWDAILMMEAEPSMVRTALEMRVMGGSDVLLAPQRGNDLGTACIDIVTTLLTPIDGWADFCQRITDKWVSYKDPSTGRRLRARPHWCKQWSYLKLPDDQGLPLKAIDWFRRVGYKDEIPLFMDALKTIGQGADFTVEDLRARFANQHLESIFWGAPDPIEVLVRPDDISSGVINKIKKWGRSCFS
jgi:hypothetical protein